MIFKAHTFVKFWPSYSGSRRFRILVFALLAVQFLPYLWLWDDAYIRIHDTLEGIDYQLLFNAGKTFDYSSNATIDQILNGQPRMGMKTGWSFVALWHWLFGLYGGYIFNMAVVHLIAFTGMYMLLRHPSFPVACDKKIALGAALCYAWIPVFSMLGLSVAGQPLLMWAFLQIIAAPPNRSLKGGITRSNIAAWAVITLFPFYSDIVWAGLPVLVLAGGYWFYRYCRDRQWNWPYLAACGWLAFLYAVANWQLVKVTFFMPDFISHRAEYDYFYNKKLSLWQSLIETAKSGLIGHHHVGIFIGFPILLAVIYANFRLGKNKITSCLFTLITAICLFYGFYNFLVWGGGDYFVLLKSFKFERIIVLLPMLWTVLGAITLSRMLQASQILPAAKKIVPVIFMVQLAMGILAHDEFYHNVRQCAGYPVKPNYKDFFDPELFNAIHRFIGQPQRDYRVVSLGIHPSIAQYNGFYTLDGHLSLYSLEYKHWFRQIMARELAKGPAIRNEFDKFGNRCYLYSAELGKEYDVFLCSKHDARSICRLDLDAESLCAMGGCYLLSAVGIEQENEAGLELDSVFEGRYWRIHLYEVTGKQYVAREAYPR